MKQPEYKISDIIVCSNKNTHSELCLILDIKKRQNYYEVRVLSNGKTRTIVDDGFYHLQAITGESKHEKRTAKQAV